MNEQQILIRGAALVVGVLLMLMAGIAINAATHRCSFEGCEQVGRIGFVSTYEEGSDAYCIELTHFLHPNWTYEQVEAYVFNWDTLQPIAHAE